MPESRKWTAEDTRTAIREYAKERGYHVDWVNNIKRSQLRYDLNSISPDWVVWHLSADSKPSTLILDMGENGFTAYVREA